MKVNKITGLIENFAPLSLQESWDNSGWQINLEKKDIKKVLLALTVTNDIINQAIKNDCDMIISHHPLFFIPFEFNKGIQIYSAHTNADAAVCGTTDTLISLLEIGSPTRVDNFLRTITLESEIPLETFIKFVKKRLGLKQVKIVNNLCKQSIQKIAFCAGSGADFAHAAREIGADILVTGDIKYHAAMDSEIILMDIGHFESERPVLSTFKELLKSLNLEVIIADEKSPFINY